MNQIIRSLIGVEYADLFCQSCTRGEYNALGATLLVSVEIATSICLVIGLGHLPVSFIQQANSFRTHIYTGLGCDT